MSNIKCVSKLLDLTMLSGKLIHVKITVLVKKYFLNHNDRIISQEPPIVNTHHMR